MSNLQAEDLIRNARCDKDKKKLLRQMNNSISLLYTQCLITRSAMVSARSKLIKRIHLEATHEKNIPPDIQND